MRKRLILGLLAGAALTAALTACGGSDDDTATSDTAGAASGGDPYDYGAPAAQATTAPAQGAAAASTAPTQVAAAPQAIEVKAGDFFYEPATLTARTGAVVVTLQNTSTNDRPHTFVVKNKSGSGDLAKSAEVDAGATGRLEFTITEPGTYEYYCNLPGHASRGQRGTLTVS